MNRGPFELCFEVEAMPEKVEDAIAARFDCLIASHSGVTTVTLTADGESCLRAAYEAMEELGAIGVKPIRLVDDLVDRAEIARRARVTRQAVGLWVRGERHVETPFPAPYVLAGGGLWLWGEVLEGLRQRDVLVDDPLHYPTRTDSQLINGIIARAQTRASGTWSRGHLWGNPSTRPRRGRKQVPTVVSSAHLRAVS